MTQYESDWVFDIGLKVAVTIFLATLAVGLVTGVAPLTAVARSAAAFAVFLTIGWAAAQVWEPPQPEEEAEEGEEEAEGQSDGKAGRPAAKAARPEAMERMEATQPARQAA
ncbi:MAG: hypothetical protein Kow0031_32060 [Anaerolineae bacterium]